MARQQWAEPIRGGEFEGRELHGITQPGDPPCPGAATGQGLEYGPGKEQCFKGKRCSQGLPKSQKFDSVREKDTPRCFLRALGGRDLAKARSRASPGRLHMVENVFLLLRNERFQESQFSQKTTFWDQFGMSFSTFFLPLRHLMTLGTFKRGNGKKHRKMHPSRTEKRVPNGIQTESCLEAFEGSGSTLCS